MASLLARYAGLPAHELDNKQQGMGCVPYDPLVDPPYHYIPHTAPGVIYVICFALGMVAHLVYMGISRRWWYASIWIGALSELMGWAARLYSHRCPYNSTAFTLQISILIIAPCFFSAALYYIEHELIHKWGAEHSLISPKWYLWIFIGADLVSIGVQGAGGGLASSASSATPPKDPATGAHVMIGGIVVQLISMSLFSLLFGWTCWSTRGYWLTSHKQHMDSKRMKVIIGAALVVDALILARNYYRAVELGEGWEGYLNSHEAYFCVFDAALMALVVGIFVIFPPQLYIKKTTSSAWVSSNSGEEVGTKVADASQNIELR